MPNIEIDLTKQYTNIEMNLFPFSFDGKKFKCMGSCKKLIGFFKYKTNSFWKINFFSKPTLDCFSF